MTQHINQADQLSVSSWISDRDVSGGPKVCHILSPNGTSGSIYDRFSVGFVWPTMTSMIPEHIDHGYQNGGTVEYAWRN